MKKIIKFISKINNLSLPVVILIASIILGGFYYSTQINKQESIERQQRLELEAEKERQNKDYIAKRKLDCLAIYEVEDNKWGNVSGWQYEPMIYLGGVIGDNCEIIYTDKDTDKDFIKTF